MKQQTNKIEWREEKLGVICDVRDGTHASPKYVQEGYPLITSKNLTNGFIDFSEINLISKSDFDEVNKRSKVDSGDIIMPMIGTIGNPVIVQKNIREFAIKNVALIKLKNSNISNIYIKFILDSPYFDKVTAKYNRGGTQKFIALGDIRNIPIPLPFSNGKPDIKEQERIVSILGKAETLKQKRTNVKDLLDEYLESVFNEMFYNKGFENKSIGELCEVISGSTPSTIKEEYWNGNIDWITPAELINGDNYYYYESQRKITQKGLDSASTLFPKDTVMLTTRAPIGKVAIAGKEMCTNQGFKNMICKKELNPIYLYFWLLSHKDYLNSLGVGATFKEISKKIVENVKIPLPPLPLQQKFVRIAEQIEKMKENVKNTKQNSEELFNSLMTKAFRGEL